MKAFIVQDIRNGYYKIKSKGFSSNLWTPDKERAMLFRSKGAAKSSCYSYSINPERRKLGAKIILPEWIKIEEININL